MRTLLVSVTALLAASAGSGQTYRGPARCGPNGCPSPVYLPAPVPIPPPVVAVPVAQVEWGELAGEPRYARLSVSGVLAGRLDRQTGVFHDETGGVFRLFQPPLPNPLPAAEPVAAPPEGLPPHEIGVAACPPLGTGANFGVPLDKLAGTREGYQLNGVRVSPRAALGIVEDAGRLADDSAALWVVVVGGERDRAAVARDLETHPDLAGWKPKVRFQDYDPAAAVVRQRGFKPDGSPAIHVLAANGASLNRLDRYIGPKHLADTLNAAAAVCADHPDWADPKTRPEDAGYDPAKDPSGPAAPPAPQPNPEPKPTDPPPAPPVNPAKPNPSGHGVWALIVAVVLYWLSRR